MLVCGLLNQRDLWVYSSLSIVFSVRSVEGFVLQVKGVLVHEAEVEGQGGGQGLKLDVRALEFILVADLRLQKGSGLDAVGDERTLPPDEELEVVDWVDDIERA